MTTSPTRAPRRLPVVPLLLGAGTLALLVVNRATSPDVYREVGGVVQTWPGWTHPLLELASEGGLVALAAVLAVVGWRALRRGPRPVAAALVGGVGTLLAYGLSELLKVQTAQERPCRALAGAQALVPCPGPGDWSLPSNHATLAAALATAVVLVAPRLWAWVLPLAVLVAASRVALGVHLPHDVTTGLVLGAVVVLAVGLPLVRPVARLVGRLTSRVGARAGAARRPWRPSGSR